MEAKNKKSPHQSKNSSKTLGFFKRKKDAILLALGWIGIILFLSFIIQGASSLGSGSVDRTQCPYQTIGNTSAELKLEYFGQPSCPYCWMYEPILKRVLEEKGDKFYVEYYDIRYCKEQVLKYSVSGTPTTVFTHNNKQQVSRGFIDETQLRQVLCTTIGECE